MQIHFHSLLWSYLPRVPIFLAMTIYIRGVTVHTYDGSVCTSVLTSQFGMISVQQGEKLNFKKKNKQWFTEQVALSLNPFSYSLNFLSDKNLPQLMLKTIEIYGYN